jgi:hypothetical protein
LVTTGSEARDLLLWTPMLFDRGLVAAVITFGYHVPC